MHGLVRSPKKNKKMNFEEVLRDRVDDLLTEFALALVNALARARKVSPHHVALAVPGLCHTHVPDARLVDGCAFCRRRGNCFVAA